MRPLFSPPVNKTLVILAAGIGSRYGGFKQMEPIGPCGEFLIDYSAYDAVRAGFNKIVFLISRSIEEDFKATIGRRVAKRVSVAYAFQEEDPARVLRASAGHSLPPCAPRSKPWGTAHALLSCRNVADGDLLAVINADDYYGTEPYATLAQFLDRTEDEPFRYAMVGFVLRNTLSEHGYVARGICAADSAGRLRSIVERTRIQSAADGIRFLDPQTGWQPLTGDELVSMNFWGFKNSIWPFLENAFRWYLHHHGMDAKSEFFLPTVINDLIQQHAVTVDVLETSGTWMGITYRPDKEPVAARIHSLIEAAVYPPNLWGV